MKRSEHDNVSRTGNDYWVLIYTDTSGCFIVCLLVCQASMLWFLCFAAVSPTKGVLAWLISVHNTIPDPYCCQLWRAQSRIRKKKNRGKGQQLRELHSRNISCFVLLARNSAQTCIQYHLSLSLQISPCFYFSSGGYGCQTLTPVCPTLGLDSTTILGDGDLRFEEYVGNECKFEIFWIARSRSEGITLKYGGMGMQFVSLQEDYVL